MTTDTYPLGLICDIHLRDGTYPASWKDDKIVVDGVTYQIIEQNLSGIPLIVTVNARNGYGFVWLRES